MDARNKPTFATWKVENLVKLASDLHDQNIELMRSNEQLRLDLKDANKLITELRNKDDWK